MNRYRNILWIAAWWGLAFGLLEGPGLMAAFSTAPVMSELGRNGVNSEILWIAPGIDLGLFLLLGCALIVPTHVLKLPREFTAFALFAFTSFLGLLILPARLHKIAALALAFGLTVAFCRWVRSRQPAALIFLRRTMPVLLGLWLALFAGVKAYGYRAERELVKSLPAAPNAANVIIIVADTLRADRVSSYGYTRPTTPHLDALARQGLLFTRAVSTSSWTLPSHASLFTGLYPDQHLAGDRRLEERHETLAEVLQRQGYSTAGFVANTWFTHRHTGLAQGFMNYEDYFGSAEDAFARTVFGSRIWGRVANWVGHSNFPGRKSAEDINRAFLAWLQDRQDRPFFAFLNYMDVHDPYLPPAEYAGKLGLPVEEIFQREPINDVTYGQRSSSAANRQLEIDAYDASLHYLDAQIGRLIEELRKRGLLEKTVLVVTSDHGEAHFEHGLFGHGASLYRETLHIPLILHYGRRISPGTRSDRVVDLADVPATVLSLLELPPTLPGRVITAPRQETEANSTDAAFSELEANAGHGPNAPNRTGWLKSLVTRRWHFIQHQNGSVQLYDWTADREELNNLANSPQHQTVVAEFRALMAARIQGAANSVQVKRVEPGAGTPAN